MHEFGIAEQVIEMAVAKAREAGASTVHTLTLRIGPMSGVVSEALSFAFEALSDGTPAQGSKLVIEQTALTCYCAACQKTFEVKHYAFACPDCGQASRDIKSGRELDIVSIEVS